MTFPELLELGKACLVEYEPRLKVLGQKPWDASANDSLCHKYVGFSSGTTSEQMRQVICAVLDRLVDLKNGFVMSGPRYAPSGEDTQVQVRSVSHNDLSLSFASGYDQAVNQSAVWVNCWYYPVQ